LVLFFSSFTSLTFLSSHCLVIYSYILGVPLQRRQHHTDTFAASAIIASRPPVAPIQQPLSFCASFSPSPSWTRSQYLCLTMGLSRYRHVFKLCLLLWQSASVASCAQFYFLTPARIFSCVIPLRNRRTSSSSSSPHCYASCPLVCPSSLPSTLAIYSSSYYLPGVAPRPARTWLPCRCRCQEHPRTDCHPHTLFTFHNSPVFKSVRPQVVFALPPSCKYLFDE